MYKIEHDHHVITLVVRSDSESIWFTLRFDSEIVRPCTLVLLAHVHACTHAQLLTHCSLLQPAA